jgi:hypothetical protein
MAVTPLGGGQPDHTMAALANDHATHAGLRINYADDGQIVVEQDRTPEARRRRLWGDTRIEARVPALPAPNELADLLTNHGAPASTVAAVSEAARAVDDAVTALRQVQAIEESNIADAPASTDDKVDCDSLWRHAEQLTALLGRYARTLMNARPVLQAGKQPQ